MTLAYFAGRRITGTSTDRTGGTWTNLPAGWSFWETDTGLIQYWNGTTWIQMGGAGYKPKVIFSLGWGTGTSTTVVARYYSPLSVAFQNATETLMSSAFPYDFTVKRMLCKMATNTLDGTFIFSFRDDVADVTGTALTIATGSTTEVDSGALSVAVAAGSKIAFKSVGGTATTGTWLPAFVYVIAELVN